MRTVEVRWHRIIGERAQEERAVWAVPDLRAAAAAGLALACAAHLRSALLHVANDVSERFELAYLT